MNLTIYLTPITKKNHQQIIKAKGHYMVVPSKQYLKYEKDCGAFMKELNEPYDFPVNVKCVFYMPTKRRCDLVNLEQSILDILVKYKIIADDNYKIVYSMDGSRVDYDKENPRTEITITPIKQKEDTQLKGQMEIEECLQLK